MDRTRTGAPVTIPAWRSDLVDTDAHLRVRQRLRLSFGIWIALLWVQTDGLPAFAATSAEAKCANLAVSRTQSISSANATVVFLEIRSHDDDNRDSHDCVAEFRLIVQAAGAPQMEHEILSSDAEWDRPLAGRLDGFSGDGKTVLGTFSEGGKYGTSMLFQYDVATAAIRIVDLKQLLPKLKSLNCGTDFAVAGTTADGEVVIEPSGKDSCRSQSRWMIDPQMQNAAGTLLGDRRWSPLYRSEDQR